jgi:hypothetical protein
MRFPVKLYKVPGRKRKDGIRCDWLEAFDQRSLDVSLARGWYLSLADAQAAAKGGTQHPSKAPSVVSTISSEPVAEAADAVADDAPPTREELEEKARELGIKFDGRTGDKLLLKRITEALEG